MLGTAYTDGMRVADIADALAVEKRHQHRLRKLLSSLLGTGDIVRVGRGVYALGKKHVGGRQEVEAAEAPSPSGPHAVGRIRVHPAGYGFVEREDGMGDVFVPAKYRGTSLDGDRVLLFTWDGWKGTEGRVEEVLARGRAKLTGTLIRSGRSMVLEPDDPRIATDYGRIGLVGGGPAGKPGLSVVVEIVDYPSESSPRMRARLLRVLGPPEDPITETEKIIVCADIPSEFPSDALGQAERTSTEVGQADLADRIDLRDRPFLTIDPETARDFDDALCIERGDGDNLRVWVAVADVSHYVCPDDALDREAQIRGVSVYLPDRVIPMLPHKLSAGICSLNPEVDRCAMVVRLDFKPDGTRTDIGFAAAVIRSHARLDYPGVAAALSGDFRGRRAQYKKWTPALVELDRLAKKLRGKRRRRGTLELEVPEAKVVLDADDPRLVRDVVRAKGIEGVRSAYELVEEFMIAANEAVGDYFDSRGLASLWRIHAPPEPDRLEELAEFLSSFGIVADVSDATSPRGLQKVLKQISGHPGAGALSFQLLRTLKQAQYSVDNVGHFGLASDRYIHFTSPIRRYPDLVVHRLLKHALHREGQASGGGHAKPPPKNELAQVAVACSAHERRAIEAEREAVAMYRALIMKDSVRDEYDGKVSGVASFGAFVELDDPFVEGLIKRDSLGDDHFEFDAKTMSLVGRRSGYGLTLGDRVRVEVAEASVLRRKVEFTLAGELPKRGAARRARGSRDEKTSRKEKRDGRRAPASKKRGAPPKKRGAKKTSGKGSPTKETGRRKSPSKGKAKAGKRKTKSRRR